MCELLADDVERAVATLRGERPGPARRIDRDRYFAWLGEVGGLNGA